MSYPEWAARYDTLDDADRSAIAGLVAGLDDPPTISVVLPVFDTEERFLRAAIESVRGQLYPHWELCVADDCSTDPRVGQVLAEQAAQDDRIRVVRRTENGHISAASNTALELTTGPWVAFLDHDDLLAPHALAMVALRLAGRPEAGVVYSDEDLVDEHGQRVAHYFKPEFDPLLLLGQNNVCHLCVVRRDLVAEVGGFREGYEGSQDWDLLLRVTERLTPGQVVHIPHVLYHWRTHPGSTASSLGAKPYAAGAGWRAVRDQLERRGMEATVRPVPGLGWNRVDWPVPESAPLVSLVVRAGEGRWLERCLQSVWRRTTYAGYEIVVVTGPETGDEARRFLEGQPGRLQMVETGPPQGPAAAGNAGAARTSGAVLCFLDGAAEVCSPDWLEVLVGQLVRPATGAVGAKLYDDRGGVHHAGLVLGLGGVAGPLHRGLDSLDIGYWGRAALPRVLSAVGGECLAVRREAFDRVDGFDDDHLPADYADVDLCLRLGEAGWATVWTPFAELVWHGLPAGPVALPEPARYMAERWGARLERDPAYNPNLSLERGDFSPAEPPRVRLPGR